MTEGSRQKHKIENPIQNGFFVLSRCSNIERSRCQSANNKNKCQYNTYDLYEYFKKDQTKKNILHFQNVDFREKSHDFSGKIENPIQN